MTLSLTVPIKTLHHRFNRFLPMLIKMGEEKKLFSAFLSIHWKPIIDRGVCCCASSMFFSSFDGGRFLSSLFHRSARPAASETINRAYRIVNKAVNLCVYIQYGEWAHANETRYVYYTYSRACWWSRVNIDRIRRRRLCPSLAYYTCGVNLVWFFSYIHFVL